VVTFQLYKHLGLEHLNNNLHESLKIMSVCLNSPDHWKLANDGCGWSHESQENMSKKLQLKFPVLAPGRKPEESIHSLKRFPLYLRLP